MQTYSEKELILLLDKVYNAFDQLGEEHGVRKIETVGKSYLACAGLKDVEQMLD